MKHHLNIIIALFLICFCSIKLFAEEQPITSIELLNLSDQILNSYLDVLQKLAKTRKTFVKGEHTESIERIRGLDNTEVRNNAILSTAQTAELLLKAKQQIDETEKNNTLRTASIRKQMLSLNFLITTVLLLSAPMISSGLYSLGIVDTNTYNTLLATSAFAQVLATIRFSRLKGKINSEIETYVEMHEDKSGIKERVLLHNCSSSCYRNIEMHYRLLALAHYLNKNIPVTNESERERIINDAAFLLLAETLKKIFSDAIRKEKDSEVRHEMDVTILELKEIIRKEKSKLGNSLRTDGTTRKIGEDVESIIFSKDFFVTGDWELKIGKMTFAFVRTKDGKTIKIADELSTIVTATNDDEECTSLASGFSKKMSALF